MSGRSAKLERGLLGIVTRRAERLIGLECEPFIRRVELRLRMGERLYGDRVDDRRDLLGEAMQEPLDVAGWGLLALQRDRDMPAEARDDVLRAIVLAAACDAYLRRAARRLREERRELRNRTGAGA